MVGLGSASLRLKHRHVFWSNRLAGTVNYIITRPFPEIVTKVGIFGASFFCFWDYPGLCFVPLGGGFLRIFIKAYSDLQHARKIHTTTMFISFYYGCNGKGKKGGELEVKPIALENLQVPIPAQFRHCGEITSVLRGWVSQDCRVRTTSTHHFYHHPS